MSKPRSISDPEFDGLVPLRDAYRAMEHFIAAYHQLGESSTVELMSDVALSADGRSLDPAMLDDFLASARSIAGSSGMRLTSEVLAALIVDALIDAEIVDRRVCDEAVRIAAAEIDARNQVRDY